MMSESPSPAGVAPENTDSFTTIRDLRDLASPLMTSAAFQRLGSVTFLGILSPRLAQPADVAVPDDGTRKEHSLGVARIALDAARHLGLPVQVQRYAAAWGLLHDIATWPLSHTSEPAFARVTGVDAHNLRRMIILGERRLPTRLSVKRELLEMGVLPDRLLQLFSKVAPAEQQMRLLWQVLHSRITPDTLEGISRAGRAYGIVVPSPNSVWQTLGRILFDVTVDRRRWSNIVAFWEAKGRVYSERINNEETIRRESCWARAIEMAFQGIGLATSLSLTEDEVVRRIRQFELPHVSYVFRYKPPLRYVVACSPPTGTRSDLLLSGLDAFLAKRELALPKETNEP